MQLTELQKEKTEQILDIFINSDSNKTKVDFKAPTGSGKTLIASAVIAGMISRMADKKLLFIIATVSTSDLPYFFEKKLNQYKPDLEYSDFEAEYIESPSSSKENKNKDMQIQLRPEQNKVYIFGKATFGKGRIFTEQNVIADFIHECKQQGYSIAYIRDEAHIGGGAVSKKDMETFESLMSANAEYMLRMTATFNKRDNETHRVELTEMELADPYKNNGKWLIKCTPKLLRNDALEDENILRQAVADFKKIQQEYKKLNIGIRPAMLIQVDNEPSAPEQKKYFIETLEKTKKILTEQGLSWVQYFGVDNKDYNHVDNYNFTLDKITRNEDTTDCIIFKIGPATGWDIPRACMLVQLRNVCSKTLNIQTIGRIKRNPYPCLEQNYITDKYYIYTNEKKEKDMEYSVFDYKVKEEYKNELFVVIKEEKNQNTAVQKEKIKAEIINFLKTNANAILTRISENFPEEKNEYIETDKKIVIKSPILLLKLIKARYDNLDGMQRQAIDEALNNYTEIDELKNVKKETIKIILLACFSSHIRKIAKIAAEHSISYKITEEKISPDAYCSILAESATKYGTTDNNYFFEIKKNGQNTANQPLDSDNETIVYDKIHDFIEENSNNVKVWAKNQRSGNICGVYLGHDNGIHKNYFDFIIKYSNGIFLYVEVKGEQDINPEKTECLKFSYRKYFENKSSQTYLSEKAVIICLAKVNKNRQITTELFYDKEKIKLNLAGMPFSKLLKALADNTL